MSGVNVGAATHQRGIRLGSMVNDSPLANNRPVTKQIFVTGGVVSSLGKGLTASSLGMLLRSRGLRVAIQKLDPYINVDPGLMDPLQHGEVFVTDDGSEADLDIGHYERFLDIPLSGAANATTGKVYSTVMANERRGDYHGETVQVIPHITNEIMRRMRMQVNPTDGSAPPDVIITEIGGTVGDIEITPYLEAARQVRRELGRDNSLFVHASLLPYLASAKELKTKPTQHSVATLRSMGIQPDVLVLRTEVEVPESVKRKVALMCDVDLSGVIVLPDAKSLYAVPKILHREGLDAFAVRSLNLSFHDVDWTEWDEVLRRAASPLREVEIGVVGKYVSLPDAYLSASEALRAGGFANDCQVKLRWVDAEDIESTQDAAEELAHVDGVLVPGGFGEKGVDGILTVLTWARERGVPTLGIGLGAQCMAIEAAQNLAGLEGATSREFVDDPQHPIVICGPECLEQTDKNAGNGEKEMRLGAYPARLVEGTRAREIYGKDDISERHRHQYEINPAYEAELAEAGLAFSAWSPDGVLVEMVELPADAHPYYIGTLAHPEFQSRPTNPHPLFASFIEAAINYKQSRRVEISDRNEGAK